MVIQGQLQQLVEQTYRVDGIPDIVPFCVSDDFFNRLGIVGGSHRESLIIHEDGETIDLAVYLSKSILDGAQRCIKAISEGYIECLDAFCAALEGVSHFVYLTFAGHQRPVSKLELELQAEIDKFLVLGGLVGYTSKELIASLFDNFTLQDDLELEARERYLVANRVARRYALWAKKTFSLGRGHEVLADARRLYRMPMASKLSRIDQG